MSFVISEILGSEFFEGCVLGNSGNHTFVRNETIGINQRYLRERINLLFIADPPPMAFLEDLGRCFYASGS